MVRPPLHRPFIVITLVVAGAVAGSSADDAVVNGTVGNDRVTLQLETGNPSALEVRADSAVVFSRATVDLSSITINGLLGDDILTVDYGNGFFAIPTTFNGGA